MNRILILDASRGIAALIVVFHHLFSHFHAFFRQLIFSHPTFYRVLSYLSDLNREAVLFFFLLSGFCIYLSAHKFDFRRRADLNTYLYKRFRRILPLYFAGLAFSLVIGFLLGRTGESSYSFYNLVGNLFFLQTSKSFDYSWFTPYGDNGPLWSLAYEMFFYLVFPFYYLISRRLLRNPATFWTHSVWLAFLFSLAAIGLRQYYFIPIFSFAGGFITWYAGVYLAHLYLERKTGDRFFVFFAVVNFLLMIFILYYPSDSLDGLIKGNHMVVGVYLFYRFKMLRQQRFFKRFEAGINFLFYRIGTGSYALYILHFPVLIYLHDQPLWLALLGMIMITGISILLERKLNRYKYTFFRINYIPSFSR